MVVCWIVRFHSKQCFTYLKTKNVLKMFSVPVCVSSPRQSVHNVTKDILHKMIDLEPAMSLARGAKYDVLDRCNCSSCYSRGFLDLEAPHDCLCFSLHPGICGCYHVHVDVEIFPNRRRARSRYYCCCHTVAGRNPKQPPGMLTKSCI